MKPGDVVLVSVDRNVVEPADPTSSRMTSPTRIRVGARLCGGLERVKMLPVVTGGRGKLLSFPPFVRRVWLGSDFKPANAVAGWFNTATHRDTWVKPAGLTETCHPASRS
jgi:hypothetical protein